MMCSRYLRRCGVRKGLVVGVLLLLLVDVIWVGSAGLTRYIFKNETYEKPLFTTYFKTALFSIYLVGFIFWRPWQRLCLLRKKHTQCAPTAQNQLQRQQSDFQERTTENSESEYSYDLNEQTGQFENQEDFQDPQDSECGAHGTQKTSCDDDIQDDKSDSQTAAMNKKYFYVPISSGETCPIEPELKVCLLGPPAFESLNPGFETDEESEVEKAKPLPPCKTKCCKVRFNRTIEVRQVQDPLSSHSQERSDAQVEQTPKKPAELLAVPKVILLSLVFGILWFFANYLYAEALVKTSVAAVNTLSSLSGVIVMVLASIPFLQSSEQDKFTLSRLVVTCISVVGAVLVALSPSDPDDQGTVGRFNSGALFAAGGAILYALYVVLLRRMVGNPESLEVPMFFGFVGLLDALIILPLVVIWHYTGVEHFEFPPTNEIWTLLLVNGFVGTVLSELLWLLGVFFTSPLLGTLSLSLVTPLSMAYSIVIGKAPFSWMFLVGAIIVLLSFIGITVLDHYGARDPLWIGIKKLFTATRNYSFQGGLSEESRRLLTADQPEYVIQ